MARWRCQSPIRRGDAWRKRRLFGPLFYSTLASAAIFLVGLSVWWIKPSLSRVWTMWTLSRRMGDSDPGIRKTAAKALVKHGKEAESWLGWVAKNGNTEARLLACYSMALPQSVGVVPDLLGALHDVDPQVRRAAAESLRAVWLQVGGACDDQMKDRAIEAIRAVIKDRAWDVRRAALWAVDVIAALEAAVERPVENLYQLMWLDQYLAALRNVAPGSEGRAVPSMVGAIDRLGRYEQRIMVDLLGKIGPDASAAVPKLIELSKSSDDRLAASAELALGKIISEPSSH